MCRVPAATANSVVPAHTTPPEGLWGGAIYAVEIRKQTQRGSAISQQQQGTWGGLARFLSPYSLGSEIPATPSGQAAGSG